MKSILTLVLMTLSVIAFSQSISNTSVPKVSFKESTYFVNEGENLEVCLDLKNFPANYPGKIKIQDKYGKATFLESTNIEIPITNGEVCYVINSSAPNNETDPFNTQELQIKYEIPADSVLITSPISEAIIFLKDDKPPINDSSLPFFLFKGVDNNVDYSFSISIIAAQYIEPGTKFLITNANYLNGSWVPKQGEFFEYIEVEWKGKYLLTPGTVLCFKRNERNGFGSILDSWEITINEEVLSREFTTYDNISDRFLSPDEWTNLYLLKDFNSLHQSDIYDGISLGISRNDFSYDIPFIDSLFQLFFLDIPESGFAYVDCHPFLEGCELVEYYKDYANWTSGLGSTENTLTIEQVCKNECGEDCLDIELSATVNCTDSKIDFLFLLDRSGSIVNQGEFDQLQEIVANVSNYLDCESDEIRFAAASFAGNGSFQIIENFQYDALDISYYNPPGGGTNVYNAYNRLKLSIDNGELVPRSDASLHVLTISDAPSYNGNGADPYEIYKTLKTENYNIKNYIIHFQDDNTLEAEKEAATASSKNGPYLGILDPNPTDPEGEGPPRHLYVYNNITSQINEAIESITACHVIEFLVPEEINSLNTIIEANNGGEIYNTDETIVETNGLGSYTITVTDINDCEYSFVYEFDDLSNCEDILSGGDTTDPPDDDRGREGRSQNNSNLSRHILYEAEDYFGQDIFFDVFLYPNPAYESINLSISSVISSSYSFEIYDSSGKKINSLHTKKDAIKIEVGEYTSGLFSIVIKDNAGNSVVKKFVVSK